MPCGEAASFRPPRGAAGGEDPQNQERDGPESEERDETGTTKDGAFHAAILLEMDRHVNSLS